MNEMNTNDTAEIGRMDDSDIAEYLVANPDFFERHVELFSQIKLTSPVIGRSISLQERQMEVVRDKLKGLELQLANLMRVARDNDGITEKFQIWTRELLLARNDVDLPHVLITHIQSLFHLQYATLRLWGVEENFSHTWFAQATSEDVQLFAKGLTKPYCGPNHDFEACTWFDADQDHAIRIASVAMMPLRIDADSPCFGMLVLGSSDERRYTKEMSTDFLTKIGNTSSAALACLIQA